MSSEAKDNTTTLNWMYKGPAGHVSREEYLLGRKVDASLDLLNQAENNKTEEPPKSSHVIEYEIVPDSVARRRPEDDDPTATVIQVDMKRKLLDDPLLAIRKREELTKMEITNNPVKRKQLELLIRSIKDDSSSSESTDSDEPKKKKRKKSKVSKKKKSKGKKKKKGKKVKKKNKKSKKESSSSSSSSDYEDSSEVENEDIRRNRKENAKRKVKDEEKTDTYRPSIRSSRNNQNVRPEEMKKREDYSQTKSRDQRRDYDQRFDSRSSQKSRICSPYRRDGKLHRSRSPEPHHRAGGRSATRDRPAVVGDRPRRPSDGDDRDMEVKRRQMMEAAQARDRERRDLVRQYDREKQQEEKAERDAQKFLSAHLTSASASSSVEERIKSRVGARQRGHDVMAQNFLKK